MGTHVIRKGILRLICARFVSTSCGVTSDDNDDVDDNDLVFKTTHMLFVLYYSGTTGICHRNNNLR